ncbi:HNH endonuclease [Candidatus Dojkabacteria bacterium]|nr:HNH endonuclease [Candidatus Dojkabacteria bacterium]
MEESPHHNRQLDLCYVCLQPATDTHEIVPRSKGGELIASNQVRLCKACHERVHSEGTAKWQARLLLAKQYFEEVILPD